MHWFLGFFSQFPSIPVESGLGVPGGGRYMASYWRWNLAVLKPGPPITTPGSLWKETCQVDLRFLHAWFVCGLDFNFFLTLILGGFVLFPEKALDSCISHANPAMCNVFYQWKNRNWMASSCEQTQCKAWAWKIISAFPKPTRHARLVNRKAVHLG